MHSKKALFISLIVFIIMSIFGFLYNNVFVKENYTLLTKQSLYNNKLILDTTIHSLNNKSDLIFYTNINTDDILQIISKANDPLKSDIARKELYNKLIPLYKILYKNGIRQLHFHLPNSISFLRFHKIKSYGDSLKGIRYSIDLVNKTKKTVRGCEEGSLPIKNSLNER